MVVIYSYTNKAQQRGHGFTSSLQAFRYASAIQESDVTRLGLQPEDAKYFVDMVQEMR